MSAAEPSLLDPDKFGLLLQCRQKMDKLNLKQLQVYAESVFSILSSTQLKKVLFVGLHSTQQYIDYSQLFQMKATIHDMIDEINKEKRLKNKQKSDKTKDVNNTPIVIIPKDASLTKYIPSDIISNHICRYLKMSSITQMAQCDRILAVICHKPSSISNLMHRYDPYRYNPRKAVSSSLIDGHYHNMYKWDLFAMHRFKNLAILSTSLHYFDSNASMLTNICTKLKHLSLHDEPEVDEWYENFPYTNMNAMPLLQSICFTNTERVDIVLHIFKQMNSQTMKSISFVDCELRSLNDEEIFSDLCSEYSNMVNMVLPKTPNKLEILRFENSFFSATDNPKCTEANGEFLDWNRITSALSNLFGFVFAEHYNEGQYLFSRLAIKILSNISSFKRLNSIHIHYGSDLQLLHNNLNALNQITELCVSVPPNLATVQRLKTCLPKLEKLCLVVYISERDVIGSRIDNILAAQKQLRLFQLVIVLDDYTNDDDEFCGRRIAVLNKWIKQFVSTLKKRSCNEQQALLFRLHIKSCHTQLNTQCNTMIHSRPEMEEFGTMLYDLLFTFFITYPFGKIQIKLSWKVDFYGHHFLLYDDNNCIKRLSRYLKISIERNKRRIENIHDKDWYTDMDFLQCAICATNKDINDNVEYDNKWKVDCRYCCNTPWI